MELIDTVEIPRFVHRIKVSNSQRPKYFKKGQKIPKKYQSNQYTFKSFTLRGKTKQLLVHRGSGKRVVANSIATKNPRFIVIKGNAIYSGTMHHTVRDKVVNEIFKDMRQHMKHLKPIDFPVQIKAELHMPYKLPNTTDGDWDLGNMMWLYGKVFEDALTKLKVYPDDNIYRVTHSAMGGLFVPVDTYEERKLVYHIYRDDRPEIIEAHNNKYGLLPAEASK